jgi:hypothetical protein
MRQLTSLLLVAVIAALSAALLWQAAGRPGSAGAPEPTLAIDADPANGMRPCSPVDASRTGAPTSGQYTVAICVVNNVGGMDAFEARVTWTGPASAPEVANMAPALDDNPDANQGAGPNGLGTMWDCTGFGFDFPTGGASSASIVCNDTTFGTNSLLTADPGLLATITMTASGGGTTTFSVLESSNFNQGPPISDNVLCSVATCVGATVTQGAGGGGPTATPTNTPTPTHTVSGPTPTPSNTPTPTHTVSGPTPTPSNTPTPTNTTTGPTATRTPTSTLGGPTATRTPTRTPTQPAGTLRGDANGDGLLDSQDALWILWAVANRLPSVPNPSKADWNGDGMLTALDALGILQFHAGYT